MTELERQVMDSGAVNDSLKGFMVMAMEDRGYEVSDIWKTIRCLNSVLDTVNAQNAADAYTDWVRSILG